MKKKLKEFFVTFMTSAVIKKNVICKKIQVNYMEVETKYLEVEHTHEDIDALNGSVLTKLRVVDRSTNIYR